MTIEFHARDGAEIARLPGQLVLANAGAVRAELQARIASGASRLVLDLGGVEFADSSGLSAILACVNAARRQGGDVALLGPMPRVRALIELTRLDDVVVVTDDESVAVASATGRVAA
ncbi:MAG: STAS domain-containing protein [Steroidobacteraceae bacterium]